MTNSYFNEGKRTDEPFFVHIDTLFNTLISGGVQFGDIRADGTERRFLVDFLGHYEYPGDAMAEAFKNPPKAEFYGRCARIDQFQSFPALDPTDVAGIHAAWVMDFSQVGEIETFLRSTSFAHMVTERT